MGAGFRRVGPLVVAKRDIERARDMLAATRMDLKGAIELGHDAERVAFLRESVGYWENSLAHWEHARAQRARRNARSL